MPTDREKLLAANDNLKMRQQYEKQQQKDDFAPIGEGMARMFLKAKQHVDPDEFARLMDDDYREQRRRELEEQTINKAVAEVNDTKKKHYYKCSLWSGDKPLTFSFSDWKVDLQPDPHAAKEIGKKAFGLAKQLENDNFNIAMSGDRGVGKTSLALAIMQQLMDNGKSGMFVSTAELLNLISRKYDDESLVTKINRIKRSMVEVDVLILDDFGTEGGMTGAIKPVHKDMQDLMYQVSNARVDFENNRSKGITIITTNNTKSELKKMYEAKFVDRVFPRNPDHQIAFENMKGVRNV